MKNSFADKLRNILRQAGQDGLDLHTIQEKMDAVGTADNRKVNSALQDLVKSGSAEKFKANYVLDTSAIGGKKYTPTIYRYIDKQTPAIKDKMWAILRARRIVSVEDLMELAGAGRQYAHEWLRMLERQDVVETAAHGVYRLIKDPVIQPENVDKAERLRRIRANKKALFEKIDAASSALYAVRLAVAEFEAMPEVDHE